MRKFYWYLTGYLKKHGLLLFLSILTASIFFILLIPFFINNFTIKKREYIGLVGDYSLANLPVMIKNELSFGLTKINLDKSTVPMLTQRWSVEDNGKTYRFLLKKDIHWQDGKELKSEDINYNFRDVETIHNANEIIFKLPDNFSPFPSIVSEPVFRYGQEKYFLFFKRPMVIGIGDNKIINYQTQGNRLTELVIETPEKREIYRFYLTESAAVTAFKKGEIDILKDMTSRKDIADWPTVETKQELENNRYLAVFFNNALPLFSKNIRQALNYALEKPAENLRALGPIDPDSWAYLPGGKAYEKDFDRAIERLLESIPVEPMKIELSTITSYTAEAEEIKKQWEELGNLAYQKCKTEKKIEDKALCDNVKIAVHLKISNFPDTANYQALLMAQESPADPDQYFLWHSSQSTNFTAYKNTRIDSLLEKGRLAIDQKERLAVYQEFQQFLLEDPPAVFLKYLYSYEYRRR